MSKWRERGVYFSVPESFPAFSFPPTAQIFIQFLAVTQRVINVLMELVFMIFRHCLINKFVCVGSNCLIHNRVMM